jgi:hypothetical protein
MLPPPATTGGFHREQQLEAFSLVELTGAFIQPLRMLLRQTQINVTSPPCGSWALPSGQRKGEQTWKLCHGSVSLDKREQWSVTYPQALSTGDCRMPDLRPDERRQDRSRP